MAEENGEIPNPSPDPAPDAVVVISYFKDTGMCKQTRHGEFPIPLLVNMLEIIKAEMIQRQMMMAQQAALQQAQKRIQLPGQIVPPGL